MKNVSPKTITDQAVSVKKPDMLVKTLKDRTRLITKYNKEGNTKI